MGAERLYAIGLLPTLWLIWHKSLPVASFQEVYQGRQLQTKAGQSPIIGGCQVSTRTRPEFGSVCRRQTR